MSAMKLDAKIMYFIKAILKGTPNDNYKAAILQLGINKWDDLLILSLESTQYLVDHNLLQLPYIQRKKVKDVPCYIDTISPKSTVITQRLTTPSFGSIINFANGG